MNDDLTNLDSGFVGKWLLNPPNLPLPKGGEGDY